MEPLQILSNAKHFLLRVISQTPPAALSSSQVTYMLFVQILAETGNIHLSYLVFIPPYLSVLSAGGFPAVAAVPVCRPGPRSGSSSFCASGPSQPEPRDGLPLNSCWCNPTQTCSCCNISKSFLFRFHQCLKKSLLSFVQKKLNIYLHVFLYTVHMGLYYTHVQLIYIFTVNS